MDNSKVKILIDEPVKDIDLDEFGHKHYIETLRDIVLNSEPPFNIGLFGKWGVGKTTILDMFKAEIEDERIKKIDFKVWKYANDRVPLKRKFILEVVDSLGNESEIDHIKELLYKQTERREDNLPNITNAEGKIEPKLAGKAFKNFIFSSWLYVTVCAIIGFILWIFNGNPLSIVCSIMMGTCIYLVNSIKKFSTNVTIVNNRAPLESSEEFESEFNDIINKYENDFDKIIIFIDDLDRCNKKTVIEVMEVMKTFMNIDKCIYIVACDDYIIRKALKEANIHEDSYLEKIFQINLSLPPYRNERIKEYAEKLLLSFEYVEIEDKVDDIVNILIYRQVKSPRKVKILINNYLLMLNIFKKRKEESNYINSDFVIDYMFLAIITVLQTDFKDFYYDLELNTKLMSYIDKMRVASDDIENYQLELLMKYYDGISLHESTNNICIKEEYENLVNYIYFSSPYSLSPEKIKTYIFLSQDNINQLYTDEYVENLFNNLIDNNVNGFCLKFNDLISLDEKISLITNLISRMDMYNNMEVQNIVSSLSNKSVVDIIPSECMENLAIKVLSKATENINYIERFSPEGLFVYIKHASHHLYANIVIKYISLLSTDKREFSYKVLDGIYNNVNENNKFDEIRQFNIQLHQKNTDEFFKYLDSYIGNSDVIKSYFGLEVFYELTNIDDDVVLNEQEKELIYKYIKIIKNIAYETNHNDFIDRLLLFIDDDNDDLSKACIGVITELLDMTDKDLDLYYADLVNKLGEDIASWVTENDVDEVYNCLLKLIKVCDENSDVEEEMVELLNSSYRKGEEITVDSYIKNISDVIDELHCIDDIIGMINTIITKDSLEEIGYKKISGLLLNIKQHLTNKEKNEILEAIIERFIKEGNSNNQNDEYIYFACNNILLKCQFIITPEQINSLCEAFTTVINKSIELSNEKSYNIVDTIMSCYRKLLNLLDKSNKNKYFININTLLSKDCDRSRYVTAVLEEYIQLSNQDVRHDIINMLLIENLVDTSQITQLVTVICYYGESLINELLENIMNYINEHVTDKEDIIIYADKILKVILNEKDNLAYIINTLSKVFDSNICNTLLEDIYSKASTRSLVIDLLINKEISIENHYIITSISNSITDIGERRMYNLKLAEKIKERDTYDDVDYYLDIVLYLKDKYSYLNNNDANKIVNELLLHLLEADLKIKEAVLKKLPLYFDESKYPQRLKGKFVEKYTYILKNNEDLIDLVIKVVEKTKAATGTYKKYRELQNLIDNIKVQREEVYE